jgi:hypothetical protein
MRVEGDHWADDEGRRLVLRGVNLGGDAKVPARPDGDTRLMEGFYDRKGVSFVGRPFPLEEADAHFSRLKRWGLDFHRFLVTWEAVEHEGPGVYDEGYLEYIGRIAEKAGEHGVSFFVDPHQDAWSRWTGGDGAPMWTLEAAGFQPERLFAAGAAHLNQELGSAYPRMTWMSNYDRLACATMWTLFFAGDAFAPGIGPVGSEGSSMQEFLQGHYIAAMAKVAEVLAPFPNVVGFDSLNEPSMGFIGAESLHRAETMTSLGTTPTPWQGILAGSGHPVDVAVYGIRGLGRKRIGTARLGAEGVSAWRDGVECLWRRAGVWDIDSGAAEGGADGGFPLLKRPAHFASLNGRPIDPTRDFLKPFMRRFDRGVCAAAEGARRFVLFVEGVPNAERPTWDASDEAGGRDAVVDATHWYDDLTLVTKRWLGFVAYDARNGKPVLGFGRVRRYFIEALRELKAWSAEKMGGAPAILGEFGLPFDLNGAKAYRSGDYGVHEKALSAYYDAVDANLLDSTIWNYSAGNRHARGDLWNTEDLSIFCRDDFEAGRTETGDAADSGGRALRGFARPYARATAGELLEMRFDARRGTFLLRFRPDPAIAAPTEVFVPELQFPCGFALEAEGCEPEVLRGRILLRPAPGATEAMLRLSRRR